MMALDPFLPVFATLTFVTMTKIYWDRHQRQTMEESKHNRKRQDNPNPQEEQPKEPYQQQREPFHQGEIPNRIDLDHQKLKDNKNSEAHAHKTLTLLLEDAT